jgi:hypothetical protein
MSLEERSNTILSAPDSRDYDVGDYLDNWDEPIPLELEVWQPPTIESQKAGSCTVQALINIIECIVHQRYGVHLEHSIGWNYGTPLNSSNNPGIQPRIALKSALKEGVMLREAWECDDENPTCREKRMTLPEKLNKLARKYISAYVRLYTKEDMQRYMMQYGLPVLAVAPMRSFSFGSGYHAVAVYGWVTQETAQKEYVYCEERDLRYTNSWGSYNAKGLVAFDMITEMWGVIPVGHGNNFEPKDIKGHWCEADAKMLIERGLVNGYDDGTVRPDKTITRGEVFALLARLIRAEEGE